MFHLLLAVIYLSFISLGLPDALLGSAWPVMYPEFGVPVSYAGIISMIISAGTIVSSLMSDRLTRKLGSGKVTAISVAMTAMALFGFSVSHSYWMLCLWAVPYGLGAGSVDAALNNYVALHYASRHMSWLHCMWGVGASIGPYIMGYALTDGKGWNMGYRYVSFLQIGLTMILIFSLPLWKGRDAGKLLDEEKNAAPQVSAGQTSMAAKESFEEKAESKIEICRPLTLREIFVIPGAKAVMITFFGYCAMETTAGMWASSYMVLHHGVTEEQAASWASLFYLGITLGRAVSGFITMKLRDFQMIRMGSGIIFAGVVLLFLPFGEVTLIPGLLIIGLGCAPVYPCIIHSTPGYFGADKFQALIGVQMASAYVGSCLMPPLFGLIANHITIALFPVCLMVLLLLMLFMHERLLRIMKIA